LSHIEQIPPELTWRIRQRVLYPDQEFGKAMLEDDEEGMHYGLFHENELISVVSLFKKGEFLQLRKFATLEHHQGKGFGSELLSYLLNDIKGEHYPKIWCNARKKAATFYAKFGFTETEHTYHKDGHDFVIMEKILNQEFQAVKINN